MDFLLSNKEAYNAKVLDVFAIRDAAGRPLSRAVGNIQLISREFMADMAVRQYTVRKTLLKGSRGGQVNIGSDVKPAMGLVKNRETFDIGYGELFLKEDIRDIKDGIVTEAELLPELVKSLLEAHDAAYIGDPHLFRDGTIQIEKPITVNSSLLSLTNPTGSNIASAVNWKDPTTSLDEIYAVLNAGRDQLLTEGLSKRNIDTLYISQQAYSYLVSKPYASDNQTVANRLAGMGFANIVTDPYLNSLTNIDGSPLGACLFMFDSRDIKWYTDLMPTILDGSPTIINNTFTLGAEIRTGGIHNVSPYDLSVYRINNLLG